MYPTTLLDLVVGRVRERVDIRIGPIADNQCIPIGGTGGAALVVAGTGIGATVSAATGGNIGVGAAAGAVAGFGVAAGVVAGAGAGFLDPGGDLGWSGEDLKTRLISGGIGGGAALVLGSVGKGLVKWIGKRAARTGPGAMSLILP